MARVGVFICHCGTNIASQIDVERLTRFAQTLPDVVFATHHIFMCSPTGFAVVKEACCRYGLDGFVVAACSPRLHLATFRRYAADCGLNPYRVEMANIREQAAWVVADREAALERAKRILAAAVIRSLHNIPLQTLHLPVRRSVLVIGGGISGIQAALTLADAGVEVHLVERAPSIGGHMAKLDKVFPTLDCAACILTPKMAAVASHPNIRLYTLSEVEKLEGSPGAFVATIRQRPRFVDTQKCVGCGLCVEKCPVRIEDRFNEGLCQTKAIHFEFAQSVPKAPVIEPNACLMLTKNTCGNCAKVCPTNAINFADRPKTLQIEVGFVVVATGYRLLDLSALPQFGWGRHSAVLSSLQFERLLAADGPTGGRLVVPGANKPPDSVAILHCVGSRDVNYAPYCSRICCTYAVKFARLIRQKSPKTAVYNLYIDIRCYGKGYEEFYRRAAEEGVHFIRGKAVRVATPKQLRLADIPEHKLVVVAEDTLAQRLIHIPADMVVLCPAMLPPDGSDDLARILRISRTPDGFFMERHPKLDPVRTPSEAIYAVGCCQGPKEIEMSVSQASAAAAKIISLIQRGEIEKEPIIASVDEDVCIGCGRCVEVCPYSARELRDGVAVVVEARCEGCGSCAAACPSAATTLLNASSSALTEAASVVSIGGAEK